MSENNELKNELKKEKTDNLKKDEDQFKSKDNEEISIEDKLKDTEEKLLRSLAEIENQRRRFEREIKDAFEFGGFNFAKETLSLLDNLQRAKQSMLNDNELKSDKNFGKFLKNFEIIEKDLVSVFEKNNIKKIDCVNKKFDPNFHQAMMEIEDNNKEPGVVLQEIQPGYTFGDRLLRPSFVGVSKKETKKDEQNEQKNKDK